MPKNIVFIFTILFLVGCVNTPKTEIYEIKNLKIPNRLKYFDRNFKLVDISKEKYFDKKITTVIYKPENSDILEQFDIYYSPDYKSMADFNGFLKANNNIAKKFLAKYNAKIVRLDDKTALQTQIWYPKQKNDNYYEINFNLIEFKKCGLSQIIYRLKFDKNITESYIQKIFNQQKEYFLQNYPKIECKKNL